MENTNLYSIIQLVWYLFYVIAMFKLLTKMGLKWWVALIPIYVTYKQLQKTWSKMAVPGLIIILIACAIAVAFPNGGIFAAIVSIAYGIFMFLTNIKLAEAFGHTWVFGLFMTIIEPVFIMILGYGKNQNYIGEKK